MYLFFLFIVKLAAAGDHRGRRRGALFFIV